MEKPKYSKKDELYRKIKKDKIAKIKITEIKEFKNNEKEERWYYKFKHPDIEDQRRKIEILKSAKRLEENWSKPEEIHQQIIQKI